MDTPDRRRLVTPSFLAVSVATLAYFVSQGILIPGVPLFVEGPLGEGRAAVGWVVGAFSVTAVLLRPVAGRMSDRRGRRLVMLLGAAMAAVSILGYEVSSSVPVLIAMRLLTGAGEALFFVGAASAVTDLAPPERRGEAMSFFSLSLYVGVGIGPLLGEGLIRGADFTSVWLASAALGALAVVLAAGTRETRQTGPEPGTSASLIHRAGLLPGVVLLASLVGMGGFFAFVPLYGPEVGLAGSRQVFLLFSAIVVVFRAFGARIPDRLGVRRTSRISLTLSAAGLGVAGLWSEAAGLYAGTFLLALGIAFATPALMAMAVDGIPPSQRGAVMGTFTAFIDIGFGVGPIVLGLVAEAFGFATMFLAGALVALVGFGLLYTPWATARTGRARERGAVSR